MYNALLSSQLIAVIVHFKDMEVGTKKVVLCKTGAINPKRRQVPNKFQSGYRVHNP